jgi:hypothetical protein
MGICPHCKNRPHEITIEPITLNGGPREKWDGLIYSCPSCHFVLSVGFDPLAIKTQMLDRIEEIVQETVRGS